MIKTAELLAVLNEHRGDAIVIPGRGGRHWVPISKRPELDVPLGDPAMGGHASFAFGLAMARPDRRVVLIDSEGDVLMGMGILPVVGEHQPKNFYHFMLDNECWATTGGQPVPHAKNVAYDLIAKGAGYRAAYAYDSLETWSNNIVRILSEPGPVFVALKIVPEVINEPIGSRKPWNTRTKDEVIRTMQKAIGVTP